VMSQLTAILENMPQLTDLVPDSNMPTATMEPTCEGKL
jgi:hypothetical protein